MGLKISTTCDGAHQPVVSQRESQISVPVRGGGAEGGT